MSYRVNVKLKSDFYTIRRVVIYISTLHIIIFDLNLYCGSAAAEKDRQGKLH